MYALLFTESRRRPSALCRLQIDYASVHHNTSKWCKTLKRIQGYPKKGQTGSSICSRVDCHLLCRPARPAKPVKQLFRSRELLRTSQPSIIKLIQFKFGTAACPSCCQKDAAGGAAFAMDGSQYLPLQRRDVFAVQFEE